jgi:putative metal-binding protein
VGRGWSLLAIVWLSLGWAPAAGARLNGVVASSCTSCHGGGRGPTVTISVDPPLVDLGAAATVTVRIASSAPFGGFYLHSFSKGTFREIAGQGARLVTPTDVVHAAPKGAAGGQITFQVGWTAPAERGTVDFEAFAVAANGDRTSGGDAAGQGRLSLAVGCPGVELFVDADGDGYGSMLLPKEQVCEGTPNYAARAGDCNDYLAAVHPGAPERCDGLDNDCNGQVDEGLEAVTVYRDADGDGYGERFTTDTHKGCTSSGYAPNQDDCDDHDKNVNPGAKEICNNKDDDCNGRADEGARATCGAGWCQRYAESCDALTCTPGKPRVEECNLYDDDCDGVIDNDAKCEAGKVCFAGRCLTSDDAKMAAEAQGAADAGAPDGGAVDAAPRDAGATARPLRTASACAVTGGGGQPGWWVALALIARSARGRGGRRRCFRRSRPRS